MRACAWVGMQGDRLAKSSYPHTPLNTTEIGDFKPNHTLFCDLSTNIIPSYPHFKHQGERTLKGGAHHFQPQAAAATAA